MLDAEFGIAAVEISHFARAYMRSADGQARRAPVDEVEIDQFAERLLQRSGRIISGPLSAEGIIVAGMGQRIGPEESRYSVGHGRPISELFVEAGKHIAKIPERILLHPLPEFPQARQTVLRRVAGNQTGIDGANRGADDPVRLDARLMQRLIDAGL